MILPASFYRRQDVCAIARELLGKVLVTTIDGLYTSGKIVETEAYAGVADKASHAFGNKKTARTAIMYAPGGLAYVYLCYGIHHLFNVVTNQAQIPHAVLIRGLEPLEGIPVMLERRKKSKLTPTLTTGPGSLSAALGIKTSYSGLSLLERGAIYIEDRGTKVARHHIVAGSRIGIAYAGADALLPYRFFVRDNPYVRR